MLYVDEHDFPEWHEFPYDLECMLPDVSETSHLMMAKFTSLYMCLLLTFSLNVMQLTYYFYILCI